MKKFLFLFLSLFLIGGLSVNAENAKLSDLEAAYGTTSDWQNAIPKSYPIDVKDNVIFGSDASYQTTNANVNNYDYIYFEVTNFVSARAVRVFFWDPNQGKRIDYFLKPIAEKETADYTENTTVSDAGTYCVKIPDGARLQGAKTPWIQTGATDPYFQFSDIYLTEREAPYVELVPYTLKYSEGKAIIPISESHIRTTGNVSINYSTGEVTNNGSGTLVIYLNNENLIGATRYHVDFTGTNLEPTLNITDAVNGEVGGIYNSRFNWVIANDGSRKNKVGAVTAFTYVFGSEHKGSMTFTSIFIEANELIAKTANKDITSLPYGIWTLPANKIGNYISADSYRTNNIDGNAHDDVLYGHDGNGDANKYVDLTNCSKIIFTGFSSNGVIRLFYNWSGTDSEKPIEVIADFPKENGTYVFDIDAFKKAKGISFFHLNGIKSQWAAVTLSSVTVDEYTNEISGTGIDRTKDFLSNPYVTFIDATGVTGSGISLDAVNKNALFKANEGVLANTSNVIVDNTIANLVLTDGGGTFKTSEGYFATSASFNREFTAGQRSTVCLPYALTKEEVEAAGEFYELTDVEGSKLVFNKIEDGTEAYKPYIFKAAANGTLANLFGKAIPASVSAELSYEVSGYTFKGVLAHSADVAGDNAGKTVYGWSSTDGSFVKVGEGVAINAFRAYIISNENATPARLAAKFVDDSITGINEVNGSEAKNADGKFFENGKIVIIKNGVKYSAAGALLK